MPSSVIAPGATGSDEFYGLSPYVSNNTARKGQWTGFDRRPKLAATMDPASFASQADIRAYTEGDKSLMLSGTNAADANVTAISTGGIQLTTSGTANDQMIVSPLVINSRQQSEWGWVNWSPERMPSFMASCSFSMAVTSIRVYLGLKLTNAFDLSTDADHTLFVFDTVAFGSTWRMHSRVASVDETFPVANIAKSTPQILTRYDVAIHVDAQRRPVFSIDGQIAGTGPALTNGAALKPFFGVQTLTGAARDMYLQYGSVSLNM